LVRPEYEEPIILYLEMLKIFFPSNLKIATTVQNQVHAVKHDLLKDHSEQASILLISRIFSLLSLPGEDGDKIAFDGGLDYDLSQFNSYVATLRFLMKSMLQSIMYRMFRLKRADMALYHEAQRISAFNRPNNNLFGYVIKRVLSSPADSKLFKEPHTALPGLFKSKEQFDEALT
jgi:hypothetical protein